nr:hypothetical protein [Tanacetum cinerariifolium]
MEQTKKTTLAYAPDVDFKPNTRMRLNSNNASRSDVEFEPISGSNTVRLNSKTVRLNSNNTSRSEQVKRSGNYFYTTGRQTDSRMKGMMKEDEGKQLDKQITPFNEEKDPYSLDFVLQDIDNNRIQVYIKKELIYMYEPLFVEGQCYQISNFGVAENGVLWDSQNEISDFDVVDVIGTVVAIGKSIMCMRNIDQKARFVQWNTVTGP